MTNNAPKGGGKTAQKGNKMSNSNERIKKIYALALKGVGGEKEQAKKILDKLLEKNSLSIDDLDEEIIQEYDLEYHGKEQLKILTQTVYKVTNEVGRCGTLYFNDSGRKCKTNIRVHCTCAQKAEIEFLFSFYKTIWEKEKERFMIAFIQKHKIFGELKEGESGTKISDDEWEKICNLMHGISDDTPLYQIEAPKK